MPDELNKARSDIAMLRSALAGLIGADSEAELHAMEYISRNLPIPEKDRAVMLNAINALLATIPVDDAQED